MNDILKDQIMESTVYKVIEVVGSSRESIDSAIQNAIMQCKQTLEHLRWFKVTEIRGCIDDDSVEYFQVALKIGFHIEEGQGNQNKQTITAESPAKQEQEKFIAEGGNSQPLTKV